VSSPAARRYARAIFDLGLESGAADRVSSDVHKVGECVSESADLSRVLSDPLVPLEARRQVMSTIADRLGVSPLVKNSVLLIADKRRSLLIPEIAAVLRELADEREGRVRAQVTSAQPLTEAQAAKLQAALEKITGRKISLARVVDPTLVGGVVTRIGDKVYDGSVRNRLSEIRQLLLPN